MKGVRAERAVEFTKPILARARNGDAGARQELARTYYDSVFAYVLANEARHGSEADALDITQETFERGLKALDEYKGDGPFERWLLMIARRTAADFYRRRGSSPSASSEDLPTNVPSPDGATPLEEVLRWEDDQRVHRALSSLSAEHNQVLQCRFVRELTVKETAAEMGRSEAAVKMMQLRALRSLEKCLSSSEPACAGTEGA